MFKEESFNEIIKFAEEAKNHIHEVVITAVEFPGFDISKVEKIAKDVSVRFKVRPYFDNED
jgi:TatD DNase family protein